MRTKLKDIPRHAKRWGIKDALQGWWEDNPWKNPRNIKVLLFHPGQGWLRWGWHTYEYTETVDYWVGGPTFKAWCAPPLRRYAEAALRFITFQDHWDAPLDAKDPDWPRDYLYGGGY